ncbi:uncharacterized protein LOC120337623 isoform X3 [Styela clava]|uniref:uncharacterized protein LOC120337623 isoform X2 n=1 Tax=Styela clava TaxID=7725 RepID=UPI00193ACCD5|nr:uncharacterized protein LOC120337623 isoform X2 [Styela clava]
MPHYICVRFQVDGRIVVVNECWLVGESHCRWPQSGNIEEMVKIGAKPKSEWGVWEIDILGGDDDYETCARRAYSTQQSWGAHHKAPTYTIDKDALAPTITPLSSQNLSAAYRPHTEMVKETTPATTTASTTSTSNPRKRKATSDAEIKKTLKRLEESISTINKNLNGRLKDIEDKLRPILTIDPLPERSPSPSYSPKFEKHSHVVLPPCNSLEELNEWLDNQDIYACAKRVTCVQLRATVRTFVRTAMTKTLAKTFSWSGLGIRRLKTKTCFKDHKVFNYLIDVLHETPHRHATSSEIADAIKKVLVGVGDWDVRRSQRYGSSFPSIAFFP